jgi:hypothetical protein
MVRDDRTRPGERADRAERAAKRLRRGIARSKAIAANYHARLLLLREALARPASSPKRPG